MKKISVISIFIVLVLAGCTKGAQPASSVATSQEPEVQSVAQVEEQNTASATSVVDADGPDYSDDGAQIVIIAGEEVRWNGYLAIEPDSNLDIRSMDFSDFGPFFEKQFPVEYETYTVMEGEITETQVVHIHSENPGPSVYVVGAVHGDERAAWYAGILLQKATISCGDLYVMAPANANGARNVRRYVTAQQDLNRSFPGDPNGNEAERLADAIFCDIEDKKPSLVLDLHEAIIYSNTRDFLGSTYIFTKLDGMDDLFFDLLFATQEGEICHNEFGFTGPGPEGSVNAEVTNQLGIPTITVETFRGFNIHRRVYDQLDTVQFALDYLGMR